MRSLELTATGIVRALTSIDAAVRGKAEALTARLERLGIETRVESEGDGGYTMVARGEDLFAREFGGLNRQPEGLVEEAIQSLKTGGTG